MSKKNKLFFMSCIVALIVGTTPGCIFGSKTDDTIEVTVTPDDGDNDADDDSDEEDVADEEDDVADDDDGDEEGDDEEESTAVALPLISLSWDVGAPNATFAAIGILAEGTCEDFFSENPATITGFNTSYDIACADNHCDASITSEGWTTDDGESTPVTEIEPGNYAALILVDPDDNGIETEGLVSEQDTLLCQSITIATGEETFTLTGTGGECVLGGGCGGGGGGGGATFSGGGDHLVELSVIFNGNTTAFDGASVGEDTSYMIIAYDGTCAGAPGLQWFRYVAGHAVGLDEDGNGMENGGGGDGKVFTVGAASWNDGGQGATVSNGDPVALVVYVKYNDPDSDLAPGGDFPQNVADYAACYNIGSYTEDATVSSDWHDSDWQFEETDFPFVGWTAL